MNLSSEASSWSLESKNGSVDKALDWNSGDQDLFPSSSTDILCDPGESLNPSVPRPPICKMGTLCLFSHALSILSG